ncbi:MAG: helix-turn-helix domain-containing protein [bacterium]|nr:helix-turn-helix domain-containing protein [bacterium]
MLKAGEILAAKRKEKNLSLLEAEEATKIRAKFLSALEDGDYRKLPNLTIARGFLKNYAEYLGLEQKSVLAVFRRETEEAKRLPLPKGMAETPQRRFLQATVNNLFVFGVISLGLAIVLYIGFQAKDLLFGPVLLVEFPPDGLISETREIEIKGKTQPEAILSINGRKVDLGQDGSFKSGFYLIAPETTIEIISQNPRKKTVTVRKVFLRQ